MKYRPVKKIELQACVHEPVTPGRIEVLVSLADGSYATGCLGVEASRELAHLAMELTGHEVHEESDEDE